jgi:hypothetical protein
VPYLKAGNRVTVFRDGFRNSENTLNPILDFRVTERDGQEAPYKCSTASSTTKPLMLQWTLLETFSITQNIFLTSIFMAIMPNLSHHSGRDVLTQVRFSANRGAGH